MLCLFNFTDKLNEEASQLEVEKEKKEVNN